MIDVAREKLLTKKEAAEYCKVSIPTVERWIRKGVKKTGRRLEVVYVGGSVRTSVEAIARFCVHPEQRQVATQGTTAAASAAMERFRKLDASKAKR